MATPEHSAPAVSSLADCHLAAWVAATAVEVVSIVALVAEDSAVSEAAALAAVVPVAPGNQAFIVAQYKCGIEGVPKCIPMRFGVYQIAN